MNGFVSWLPVLDAPAGLRLAVKDVIDVAGMPTGAGNPRWLATHSIPQQDAAVVRALRAEFTVVGKTHTDELAFSLSGTNAHYGTPVNPVAPERIPGGSSSGTAAVIAAGLADLGLGTDTAGSIRVPASYTGIFGLRPTHSRAPHAGIVPLAPSFDVPALLARDLATLRAGARLMLDGTGTDARPRTVWWPADIPVAEPVRQVLRSTLTRLVGAGFELTTAPLFEAGGWDRVRAAFSTAQAAQVWEQHGEWVRRERPIFGRNVSARLELAAEVTPRMAAEARSVLRTASDRILRALADDRVLALPATPYPAPLLDDSGAGRAAVVRLTCLAPILGAPALSLPVARIDGLPLGLSLIASPGCDESLLATAELLR
ncbi:amidase family protein [Nocardia miyunensis]|uniref:amidase family protein n=1 Tax=Nocardia miyunensis TaxID=282684 RepID=UPI0008361547|nr:amidase family protein [Nocardia miyunensis]